MRKHFGKAFAALSAAAMLLPLAACGGDTAANGEIDLSKDTGAITIYTETATYEGKLDGYVGKAYKEKTGQDISVVPDQVGGTSRFATKLTTGDLGDLIVFSTRDDLMKAVDAGAVLDLNTVKDQLPNVFRFTDAIKRMEDTDGGKVWGMPTGPALKAEIGKGDPTNVPSLRYDYYKELGSPTVKDYWSYKDVAEAMARKYPKTENGDNFYALSLFGGWDKTNATQLRSIAYAMGWTNSDGVNNYTWLNLDPINKKTQGLLDDNSLYLQALEWANGFYRDGQLDPDSATQTWDDYLKKAEKGQSAMWVYGYMGNLNYNPANKDMTAQNKGYERIVNDELKTVESASTIGGNWFWAISSSAKNPAGALKFLNYHYSDEGAFMFEDGPEGVLWKLNDKGEPEFTDLGKQPWSTTEVPAEYGGGKIADTFKFRVNGMGASGTIEKYHSSPVYNTWTSYLRDNASNLDKEWSQDNGGVLNVKEKMIKDGTAQSFKAKNVAPFTFSDEDKVVSQSVGDVVKQYSWKMIYAKSTDEFKSLEQEMVSKAKSLGYDKLVSYEQGYAQKFFDAPEI